MQDHIEFDNFFIDTSEAAAFDWGLKTWSAKHKYEKAEEAKNSGSGGAFTEMLMTLGEWMTNNIVATIVTAIVVFGTSIWACVKCCGGGIDEELPSDTASTATSSSSSAAIAASSSSEAKRSPPSTPSPTNETTADDGGDDVTTNEPVGVATPAAESGPAKVTKRKTPKAE
jgi:hypothetical protein